MARSYIIQINQSSPTKLPEEYRPFLKNKIEHLVQDSITTLFCFAQNHLLSTEIKDLDKQALSHHKFFIKVV